jgi:hypothetical protein
MNVMSIFKEISENKRVALPVVLLTLLAAAYVAVLRPPEYVSDSALALVNPPSAPTPAQIASDPALGKINANNPYVQYNDLTVVVALIQQALNGQTVANRLKSEGVPDGYTVQPTSTNLNAPIIDVSGVGSTPAVAAGSAAIIDREIAVTLNQLQQNEGVARGYRITTQLLNAPSKATLKVSGKLRSLIAVLALGVVMMFVTLSIHRGLAERKRHNVDGAAGYRAGESMSVVPPARRTDESDEPAAHGTSVHNSATGHGAGESMSVVPPARRTDESDEPVAQEMSVRRFRRHV